MSKVVCDIAVSADGYVAGPNQTPTSRSATVRSRRLHAWMFETGGREQGRDRRDRRRRRVHHGAQHVRARCEASGTLSWKGWWGDDPPYHGPVFVLTHHAREPLADGGRHHVHLRHRRHRGGAGPGRGRPPVTATSAIAGGAATINQYLAAGLIDELRTHIAPLTAGPRRASLRRRARR